MTCEHDDVGATTAERKRLGAWYTPPELVEIVTDGVLEGFIPPHGRPVRVLDPACGDGRLLLAVGRRLCASGVDVDLTGCDIDRAALDEIDASNVRRLHADALAHDWGGEQFDVVVGNPPFLSQMATDTTRGGSSRHGGGPYADVAVEFLALAVELSKPDGGRVGLILPQSVLGARDTEVVRRRIAARSKLTWSWWASRQQHFDAAVNVCALGFESCPGGASIDWTGVVTDQLGVPNLDLGRLAITGTLADHADLNANFRDEYYALVPVVSDACDGPPLITSGLIDPGECHWGRRHVRFAKQRFERPRVDVGALEGRFRAWADRKLVPKVLVANQTRIIEAVADPDGVMLPGVPVTTATPTPRSDLWEIASVLTGPVASIAAWQLAAGTGLSTTSVRLGPAVLGATPWPCGDLTEAAAALRAGDISGCAAAGTAAYGIGEGDAEPLMRWWLERLPASRDD